MAFLIKITIVVVLSTFIYAHYSGAPWVPTKRGDKERFLKLAKIKPGDVVYDLGCGNGKILFATAEAGAKARGFEISLIPLFLAKTKQFFYKHKERVEIHYKNMWKADLKDADVVYLFLMPKAYEKMKQKLEKELKSGARVVTYAWPIEGWKPERVDSPEGKQKLFLYKI